jgi:hypothetical protein
MMLPVKVQVLIPAALLLVTACEKSQPKQERAASPAPMHAASPGDCAALSGANAVQTEMRRLECALQHAIVAIGRDDLPSIATWIGVVHEARTETEKALDSGAYKPAGDVQAFAALDQAFHGDLEKLVEASAAKDHAAVTAALGRALGQCQGCHAVFRPVAPGAATGAPAPVHAH